MNGIFITILTLHSPTLKRLLQVAERLQSNAFGLKCLPLDSPINNKGETKIARENDKRKRKS